VTSKYPLRRSKPKKQILETTVAQVAAEKIPLESG
jgi:hypothetical protein